MIREWSLFTKPWKTKSVDDLGNMVKALGFDAIEFPLRDGYQVEPKNAEKELPILNNSLKKHGIHILSVASSMDEPIFAACQASDIHMIRIMAFADQKIGYMKSLDKIKKDLYEKLPLCEKYNVVIGVQNHYGFGVSSTMELHYLLEEFEPKMIGAVWDAAHSALAGEIPSQALDIIWDKLVMVNLKTAYYKRMNGPECDQAVFRPYFTTGSYGASSWKDIAGILKERHYDGNICMPAEYTDERNVDKYISKDIAYAKSLF